MSITPSKSAYGVIPGPILYDRNLSDQDKLMYCHISNLCNEHGFCWASNAYIAELTQKSLTTVKRILKKLNDLGYLNVRHVPKNNHDQRHITLNHFPKSSHIIPDDEKGGGSKMGYPQPENGPGGGPKMGHIIYKEEYTNKNKKEHPLPPKGESADAECVPSSQDSISQEAKQLANDFVEAIREFKPDYVPPKKRPSWAQSAEAMIAQDKRDPSKVIAVLKWALRDNVTRGDWSGWSKLVIGHKNPVSYIRLKYDTMDTSMSSKAKRGFLPNSDQSEARRIAEEMFSKAVR